MSKKKTIYYLFKILSECSLYRERPMPCRVQSACNLSPVSLKDSRGSAKSSATMARSIHPLGTRFFGVVRRLPRQCNQALSLGDLSSPADGRRNIKTTYRLGRKNETRGRSSL